MVQLASNNTLIIELSCFEPVLSSYTIAQDYIIQGTSFLLFDIQNVDIGIFGLYTIIMSKNGNVIKKVTPTLSGTSLSLPLTSFTVQHEPTDLIEEYNVLVKYRNGYNVSFNVTLSGTSENILDFDMTLLNTQLLFAENQYIPILNLESNDNTIYPVAYFQPITSTQTGLTIYLKTDPETTPSLSASTFDVLSTSNYINTEDQQRITAI